MASTIPQRIFSYFSCLCLFASIFLVLIPTISAPITKIPIFQVDLFDSSSLIFGSFGYCITESSQQEIICSQRQTGYDVAGTITEKTGIEFDSAIQGTVNGLTHAMALHAVALTLSILAFLSSLWTLSRHDVSISYLTTTLISLVAWIFVTSVTAVDFSIINPMAPVIFHSGKAIPVYTTGLWCIMAAFIIQFVAIIIFSVVYWLIRRKERREEQREDTVKNNENGSKEEI